MLFDPTILSYQESFKNKLHEFTNSLIKLPQDNRSGHANYYCPINYELALELLADWPMSPENRVELDDLIWAIQSLADKDSLRTANLVFMDWDTNTRKQMTRDRSMLQFRANPERSPYEQVIANIFQGRSGRPGTGYLGDFEMTIPNSITIQIHLVKPFYEKTPKEPVYALGLIFPDTQDGFIIENQRL
jgi:hypothetical protein